MNQEIKTVESKVYDIKSRREANFQNNIVNNNNNETLEHQNNESQSVMDIQSKLSSNDDGYASIWKKFDFEYERPFHKQIISDASNIFRVRKSVYRYIRSMKDGIAEQLDNISLKNTISDIQNLKQKAKELQESLNTAKIITNRDSMEDEKHGKQ